jgi:geranylgeranylglycerol-phosphate geranylgeranyltransferase
MSLKTTFLAIIQISRPFLDLGVGLAVFLGQIIALKAIPSLDFVIPGFLAGFFVSASSMISDDIYDIEVDRINAPHWALPSGKLSILQAHLLTVIIGVIGVFFALFFGLLSGIIAFVFAILGYLYNYQMKELGLPGNLIVGTSAIVPFVLGKYMLIKVQIFLCGYLLL